MKELSSDEIAHVSGGLSDIQNVGLNLALAALGLAIVAIAVAPVAVVGGGLTAVFGVGSAALGALSGAAFAMPPPPSGGGGDRSDERVCGRDTAYDGTQATPERQGRVESGELRFDREWGR